MARATQPRAQSARAVVAMLTFGGLGILLIFAVSPHQVAPVPVATLATVQLSDDDADQALFDTGQLAPDQPVSNCLRITYGGPAGAGQVRLLAADVAGPLASSLHVRVDVGTGGRFGDCTGFAGTQVYDGTLAGLAGGTAIEPGVGTGWIPQPGQQRTYRLTATLPDDGAVQGTSATATLTWVVATPTPATTYPASAAPPSTPPPSSAAPVAEPTGSASATPGSHAGSTGGSRRDGPARPTGVRAVAAAVGQAIADGVEVAVELSARTAKHSGFPLASLAAIIVFLVAQNRFDGRDPKLALAPVYREPYLDFDGPDGSTDEAGDSPTDGWPADEDRNRR